ncbi:transcriptional regulator [Saccharomonospora marina XMU15]|uniref:Transcriptional regulator n=1 Tax=Saccharomonospora marina XMU15 TaxID=882083 RepID=H5X419_9PSEU|nr:LacI family DNA-binding transcriptional regulator [Saccharomonospora marina]EHR53290.1 transcriptional regulator [Saccharomonospora marina XMU15]
MGEVSDPPVTLRTLADRLGLHVSTVSRVLHAKPGETQRAASSATIRRVRKLADELGYRPNPHASSLRTKRSNLVAVLVPRLSDTVLAAICEGIEEAAGERGLSTIITSTKDVPALRRARAELALGQRVDGIIFGDAVVDGALLAEISARGTPFVLVNRRAAGYPAVTCDDYVGGRMVADHLLGLGHTDVAVVAGRPYASTGIDRAQGFLDAYADAGIELPTHRFTHCAFDERGGHEATARLLDQATRPPSAVFAVTDAAALGAVGALRDRGIRVGTDIAVAGFGDTAIAAELPVPLTTVRSPMHRIGRIGLELLGELLRGGQVASRRLRPELVIRESTTSARPRP